MKAGIDVYASKGTFEVLKLSGHRAVSIQNNIFNIGRTFGVLAFKINHDAADPLGFLIREHATNEYLLFCPDSSHLVQRFYFKLTIAAMECSYDPEILRKRVADGGINEEVAKRIVQSHAGRDTTLNYLLNCCDLSRCLQIHLLHCSGANLDKAKTVEEFERKLHIKTIIKGIR